MLNQVNFEGFVVNSWTFGNDIFVRIASYRDPGQPIKRLNESKDEPDYVNVRFTNAANQLPQFPTGTLLRVDGLLQSREYNETLDEFLKKARKNGTTQGVELTGGSASKVVSGRSTVEILARQHVIISQPDKEKKPVRKPDVNQAMPSATSRKPVPVEVVSAPVAVEVVPVHKVIKKNKPIAVPEAQESTNN